jgi:sugar O-acyltransferase (sialic acid O-acetyltransferase NeuD family)
MNKVLFGYGGHAKEVMCQMGMKMDCYVDDKYVNEYTLPKSLFNPENSEIMITISDPIERERIVNELPKNTKYFSFIHPTAILMDNNISIGEGSFIGANSIITTNIKIGNHTILNRGNHIGHDSELDDFLSMMPGAIISGNVKTGKRVYLGTNSTIKEKVKICDDVIIGLNSGIIKDIKEKGIYVGLPAKKIK